jgi:hypothetical protein
MKKHLLSLIILNSLLFTAHINQAMDQRSQRPLRTRRVDDMLRLALAHHSMENALNALRQGANPHAESIQEFIKDSMNEGDPTPSTILNDAIAQFQAEQAEQEQ